MSRNRRRHARTVAGAVAAGVLAVTAVSGCGAGFSAETNHVTGSVNGQDAVAANIVVRNAWLRGPANLGEQTEMYMVLLNRGGDVDRLSAVVADFATGVVLPGNVTLKSRRSRQVPARLAGQAHPAWFEARWPWAPSST